MKTSQAYRRSNDIFNSSIDEQIKETDLCGLFQLYFYKNLFQPSPESNIINDRKLTKNIISKLLNEMFSLNRSVNKENTKTLSEENSIKFT